MYNSRDMQRHTHAGKRQVLGFSVGRRMKNQITQRQKRENKYKRRRIETSHGQQKLIGRGRERDMKQQHEKPKGRRGAY